MRLPAKPPTESIEDYHTHFLEETNEVLHVFNLQGKYLETKDWSSKDRFNPGLASSRLESLVEELGTLVFKDTKSELFQTTIDRIIFDLVRDEES